MKVSTKIGDKFTNKQGLSAVVLWYNSCTDVGIRFIDTGSIRVAAANALRSGEFKDYMSASLYGIGVVGIGDYCVYKEGNHMTAYKVWEGMLRRCYKGDKGRESYADCTVCDEWLNYQTFCKWFYKHYITGYHLDKDILVKGSRVYSPTTCRFIPSSINVMVSKNKVGKYKIGAKPCGVLKKSFKCSILEDNKMRYIGSFPSEDEASEAYKKERLKYVKGVAFDYYTNGLICEEIYDALLRYYN